MTDAVHTTPAEAFVDVPFAAAHPVRRVAWHADGVAGPLELAVVDAAAEQPERGTFLLLHGEPSWSHLYHQWIPRLTAAGYRCVAPDLPGFGRSDKPTDDGWYSYARHGAALGHVIDALDLDGIHIVVQDWAGPIGLRQLVAAPDRFRRAFVFNTWLHHDGYEYSDGLRWWHGAATDPEQLGGDMPTGDVVVMTLGRDHDTALVKAAYDAPFAGAASKAGARAFPAMLPFARPDVGGAEQQEHDHHALRRGVGCPVHIAFGDADPVFTWAHAESWAQQIPGATLDRIPGAGHFVQLDAPGDCLDVLARHLGHDL